MKVLAELAVNNSGQSLVEVIAAIGIVLLILTGIITATTYSVRNARFAKTQSQATKLANELNEWIRSKRDELGWDTFKDEKAADPGSTYCFNDSTISSSWPSLGPCLNYSLNNIFKREAILERVSDEHVTVKINVYWQSESGEHKSSLETYLTNW